MMETVNFREEVLEYDRTARFQSWNSSKFRLSFRTLGAGETIILIPGLASTYRGYAPTLLRLARHFQTIIIDYPGENLDDRADLRRIDHDDLVHALIGLIDHLGLAQVYPFGLSFGSTITLKALHQSPDRFPKAVLQGAFARRRLNPHERMALALGRRFQGTTSRLPFHELGLARNNRVTFPRDQPDLWKFYVEENGLTSIAGLTHRLDLLDKLDLRPILAEIRQDVRVIQGVADRIVPMKFHRELVEGLPQGESRLMVAGVGHQPHWTHPAELARWVGEFLGAPPPVWR